MIILYIRSNVDQNGFLDFHTKRNKIGLQTAEMLMPKDVKVTTLLFYLYVLTAFCIEILTNFVKSGQDCRRERLQPEVHEYIHSRKQKEYKTRCVIE